MDELAAQTLAGEARDRAVLARAEDPRLASAFEIVLGVLTEDGLDGALSAAMRRREIYAALGEADPEPALAACLDVAPGARPDAALARWRAGADPELWRRLAAAFREHGGKTEQAKAADLDAAAADSDPARARAALAKALLTQKGEKPSKFPTQGLGAGAPWTHEVIPALQDGLIALASELSAAERLEETLAFTEVARRVLDGYAELKRTRGLLDYDDLIGRAVGLLTRSEARDWVRFKLDGGIEHILVDEAQDTSPEQWRAIGALAEEFFAGDGAREDRGEAARTIFAVGDEKQSIYSFQGAEPRLLAEKGADIAARAEALGRVFRQSALETSFRSSPTVLDYVDQVFASEEAAQGLVFGASAVRHVAARRDEGRVELWPLVTAKPKADPPPWDAPLDAPPPDNPTHRLAELVAETIHGWIGREPLLSEGRAMRAGDILVLVRKRGALSNGLIKRLKQLGAPVAGADRLVLTSELVIRDLLALGEFCLNPEDDLALATLLRGPFCAVDEAGLFTLAHERSGARRLWYALQERQGERPDYAAAYGWLSELVARADYLRPFELFAHALGPLGGRPRLTARLGREAEDPVDEFLAQTLAFERSGAPTLQNFVGWMRARAEEVKREHEQDRDEIRVMTAHGAKGLEAPVVVMPDTTNSPRPGAAQTPSLYPTGVPGAPPIWTLRRDPAEPAALSALREAHMAREEEEHRRLLYVALTRARDRLLICGAASKSAPEGSWYDLCARAIETAGRETPSPVRDAEGASKPGWRIGSEDAPAPPISAAAAERATAPETAAPLPAWLFSPAPKESAPSDIAPSHLGGADPEAEGAQYGGAGPGSSGSGLAPPEARRRGEMIHLLLEILPPLRPEGRRVLAERTLAREAASFSDAARAAMIDEALGVLDDPACAEAFGARSFAEVPVAAVLPSFGPGEMRGFIDRLIVKPREVLIVDFKTGAIPERPPEAYVRQLSAYRAALRLAYPDREIAAALLWTAGPKLERIAQETLDAAFHAASVELDRRRRGA